MYTYYKGDKFLYRLEEVSYVVLEEVSSGVYYLSKDRYHAVYDNYYTVDGVVKKLNEDEKVTIKRINGDYVSNFDAYNFE